MIFPDDIYRCISQVSDEYQGMPRRSTQGINPIAVGIAECPGLGTNEGDNRDFLLAPEFEQNLISGLVPEYSPHLDGEFSGFVSSGGKNHDYLLSTNGFFVEVRFAFARCAHGEWPTIIIFTPPAGPKVKPRRSGLTGRLSANSS